MTTRIRVDHAPLRPLTRGPSHHFFGYFDKSPWLAHHGRELLLAHRTNIYDRLPAPGEPVEIGYFDLSGDARLVKIGESRAWNLQQGAMAQWLPRPRLSVLYNDIQGADARAVIVDVATGARQIIDRPVAAVSPDGRQAVSLNFGRLTAVKPEYGYSGLEDAFAGQNLPEDDGLWRLDLESGKADLLLSLARVAAVGADGGTQAQVHYVNHPLFNRDGTRFCFLHRYINAAGTQHTRLLSCRSDGSDLRLLISGMASHFGWRNATELLAWAGERKLIKSATTESKGRLPVGKILRKLYRALGKPAAFKSALMNDRYIAFDHADGAMRTVVRGVLRTDGHCSFSPDGKWFVTDSYPDKAGLTALYICHWATQTVIRVAQVRFPPELDNEVRCDLHPRWHPSKPLICVDAVQGGERQMFEIDVSGVVGKHP